MRGSKRFSRRSRRKPLRRGEVAIRTAGRTGWWVRAAAGDANLAWIAPYLHYFYVPTDNRIGVERSTSALLLTPVGDETLAAKYPTPATRITHSIASLYPTLP